MSNRTTRRRVFPARAEVVNGRGRTEDLSYKFVMEEAAKAKDKKVIKGSAKTNRR